MCLNGHTFIYYLRLSAPNFRSLISGGSKLTHFTCQICFGIGDLFTNRETAGRWSGLSIPIDINCVRKSSVWSPRNGRFQAQNHKSDVTEPGIMTVQRYRGAGMGDSKKKHLRGQAVTGTGERVGLFFIYLGKCRTAWGKRNDRRKTPPT